MGLLETYPYPLPLGGMAPGGPGAESLCFGAIRAAARATESAEPRAETGVPRTGHGWPRTSRGKKPLVLGGYHILMGFHWEFIGIQCGIS